MLLLTLYSSSHFNAKMWMRHNAWLSKYTNKNADTINPLYPTYCSSGSTFISTAVTLVIWSMSMFSVSLVHGLYLTKAVTFSSLLELLAECYTRYTCTWGIYFKRHVNPLEMLPCILDKWWNDHNYVYTHNHFTCLFHFSCSGERISVVAVQRRRTTRRERKVKKGRRERKEKEAKNQSDRLL